MNELLFFPINIQVKRPGLQNYCKRSVPFSFIARTPRLSPAPARANRKFAAANRDATG